MARFGIDWDLPEGWVKKVLSEVAEINPAYRVTEEGFADSELPFVPMANVPEGGGVLEEFEWRGWQQVKSGKTRFQQGDTLFAKITPCTENGKVAFIESMPKSVGFGSTEFHVISPGERLVPKFLFHFLRTQWVRDNAIGTMIGTTNRQRVPSDFFRELEIPLPPLAEQARIVAKLDRIERARRAQKQAIEQTQALLKAALAQVFDTRDGLLKGWNNLTLGKVAIVKRGISKRPAEDGTVPIIRIANLEWMVFNLDTLRCVHASEKEIESARLSAGDIVFSPLNGSLEHLGKCAIVDETVDGFLLDSNLSKVVADSTQVLPGFLLLFLCSDNCRNQVLRVVTKTSAGQYLLKSGDFLAVCIPIPLLSVQQRIVAKLDRIQRALKLQREALGKIDALMQSALHRAFRGEL